ncbi:DNA (cytosine-5-)-methyltransferase [Candidatus Pseudothioglobus sp. Uisw_041]|uniref:DNA (cytosine-5-)-methyltransferase n=1 Tax=Candidatus Pseudothioglobus sp. Uisw_041 TaxID=3230996 RepID=UPI003A8699D9
MIDTIELFAGVGGFRVGLEKKSNNGQFNIIWSNQWEPGSKIQYASDIYIKNFGNKNHNCEDIAEVVNKKFKKIPNHDLLVGGFPCQDYSVARSLNKAGGIKGKKGVLWWSIYNLVRKKRSKAPKYLMLENVDRLLKSPTSQRGRDFAIMLASLSDLGYAIEWRVINASDYGMPQKRKRVYIMAYRMNTPVFKKIKKLHKLDLSSNWIFNDGVMQDAFPMNFNDMFANSFNIDGSVEDISENYEQFNEFKRPFANAGLIIGRKVFTAKGEAIFEGEPTVLDDIVEKDEEKIPNEFYIDESSLKEWKKAKDAKSIPRVSKDGYEYNYSEGKMSFPDKLNKPSRTIVTGEGGKSVSRFKHVIQTDSGRYRRLMPLELERLNMFEDEWTVGAPDAKRAFFMGNALVVGIVEKLSNSLLKQANE